MYATNEKSAPPNGTPSNTPRPNFNSCAAQRQRLLEALRHGMVSTITARRDLDILSPAARIIELRKHYQIDMVWIKQPTDCGKLHRVALYVLKSEGAHHGS